MLEASMPILRVILMVAIAALVIVPCMLPVGETWPSLDQGSGLAGKFNLDPALPYRSRPDAASPRVSLPGWLHPVYAVALVEGCLWIGLEDLSTGRLVWIEEALVRRRPVPDDTASEWMR